MKGFSMLQECVIDATCCKAPNERITKFTKLNVNINLLLYV